MLSTDNKNEEKQMFDFTKKHIQDLEAKILKEYEMNKKVDGLKVTKLDFMGAVRNDADLQKEMLAGHYQIMIKDGLTYSNKIVKLA